MTVHASFPKELPRSQNCVDRFLALLRHDRKLDSAALNVKNRICNIPLLEHALVLLELQDRLPGAHLGEKLLGVKRLLGRLRHENSFQQTCSTPLGFPGRPLFRQRRPTQQMTRSAEMGFERGSSSSFRETYG